MSQSVESRGLVNPAHSNTKEVSKGSPDDSLISKELDQSLQYNDIALCRSLLLRLRGGVTRQAESQYDSCFPELPDARAGPHCWWLPQKPLRSV